MYQVTCCMHAYFTAATAVAQKPLFSSLAQLCSRGARLAVKACEGHSTVLPFDLQQAWLPLDMPTLCKQAQPLLQVTT